MSDAIYKDKIVDHYKNPRNFGSLKNASSSVKENNPSCGDEIEIQMIIEDNKIKDIKFQTLGCPAAIAASDVLCELVKGKSLKEAENINETSITKKLGGLPMIKVHCSVLGAKTLKNALENYRKKQKQK